MNTHPLRRLIANAIDRKCVLVTDEQYIKALVVLMEALAGCENLLPAAVRVAWERVKQKGELM